jgi:hypothetical protein
MAEARPGTYASYTPELSTRPFDPRVANSPDGQWRVVPFSFGLPTAGLDADVAQGHRLLHRFAFPTYHRVIWVQSPSRHRTRYDILETCIGDVDRETTFDEDGRSRRRRATRCTPARISGSTLCILRSTAVDLRLFGVRTSTRPSAKGSTGRAQSCVCVSFSALCGSSPLADHPMRLPPLQTAVAPDTTSPQIERVRVASTIKAIAMAAKVRDAFSHLLHMRLD